MLTPGKTNNFYSIFTRTLLHRPFSYSAKEPGSSIILYIFIHEIRSNGVRASITIKTLGVRAVKTAKNFNRRLR